MRRGRSPTVRERTSHTRRVLSDRSRAHFAHPESALGPFESTLRRSQSRTERIESGRRAAPYGTAAPPSGCGQATAASASWADALCFLRSSTETIFEMPGVSIVTP